LKINKKKLIIGILTIANKKATLLRQLTGKAADRSFGLPGHDMDK